MGLRYNRKIKVRYEEKLSDSDRLLEETVETPLVSIFQSTIDKYEARYQCTAPYLGYEAWDK